MAAKHKADNIASVYNATMTQSPSPSPMPSSSCPSPYFSTLSSEHSSPYPSTPGNAPHWYFVNEHMHDCLFRMDTCKGCDGTSRESHFDDGPERQSPSALSPQGEETIPRRSLTPYSSTRSISSPEVTRVQLKEEFLRLYFPAGIADQDTDFMFSKFLGRESLESLSQTMQAAVDTLGLIQLGTYHSDDRLIKEAQNRYQAAVAALNRDLEDPDAMYDDGVLGAIYLLGFCEVYEPLSQGGQPWRVHHGGLRELLLSRGPKGKYSKFSQLLVYNFRHIAAIVGFTERKQAAFAGAEWRRCSAITDGLTTALSEQLIAAPGVLERADRAMQQPSRGADELLSVLLELTRRERDMQAWLLDWYSSFEPRPYWQTSVERLEHFQEHIRAAPTVFKKAIQFSSFSTASSQASYWIALLQLKQTIYDLNRLCQDPILPKAEATLVAEAYECADRLCESVAWFCQPQYGFCGVMRAMGPLNYALRWYSTQMDLEKMAWCEKVGKSLKASTAMASFFANHPLSSSAAPQQYRRSESLIESEEHGDYDRDNDDDDDDDVSMPS